MRGSSNGSKKRKKRIKRRKLQYLTHVSLARGPHAERTYDTRSGIALETVCSYNSRKRSKEEWRKKRTKRRKRKEKGGFIVDVSLVLVLKIIFIVFKAANDALVSKITNKRKEINGSRSFNTIC